MSTPPLPPGQSSKGMPTIAKVGIGCGALIAILVIAGAILLPKVMNKLQEVAEDPSSIMVWALEKSPEIEVVEHDKEGRTLTIRLVETGEVVSADYEKLSKGELVFTNEKGEVLTLDPSSGEGFKIKRGADSGEAPAVEAPVAPAAEPQ